MRPAPSRLGRATAIAVLVVVAASLVGCSWTDNDTKVATAGLPDLQQSLRAHTWQLDWAASTVEPTTDATVTLEFDERTFSGQVPCNRYAGEYRTGEGSITVDVVGGTAAACLDPTEMAAEDAYLAALGGSHDVDATDRDRLVLEHDGTRLEFTVAD